MSKANYNLVVVAHPDDETLFFSGLLQRPSRWYWKVICVTDGNADGHGSIRHGQFKKAMSYHRVKSFEVWNFPDIYEQRLDVRELVARLTPLRPQQIFTHGILGEYGHPHHQDVAMAVHSAFATQRVMSVAYNCFPDLKIHLTAQQFAVKTKVLSTVYQSETRRFVDFLPATSSESFAQVGNNEVTGIYEWLTTKKRPASLVLKKFRWYLPYLEDRAGHPPPRPF